MAVSPEASLDAMTFALNAVQAAGIQKVSVTQQDAPDGPQPPATTSNEKNPSTKTAPKTPKKK